MSSRTTSVPNIYTSTATPMGGATDPWFPGSRRPESQLIKGNRPGLLFVVESKDEIQIEKAGLMRESYGFVNGTKVVGFIAVVRPEPERLKILVGNGVS